jgi:cytochrome c
MQSWDMNKVIGSVLATVLFILAIKMIAIPIIYDVEPPAKPGYIVQGVQEASSSAQPAKAEEEAIPDWGTVLPTADAKAGEQVAQRCAQCHDWSKGGPDKIGPNLWGVIDRPRASRASFSYSSAMSSNHDPWTFDKLFVYLKSPASMVPGTKMSFAGLRSGQDRINLLAYLRTQSDSPVSIPPPQPKAAAPAPAAPTGKAPAAPAAAPAGNAPSTAPASNTPATTPAGKAPAATPSTPLKKT